MGRELRRWKRRKAALNKIDELLDNEKYVVVIHYACERFRREEGKTPRVTCIVIRNLQSGQTESFSMHRIAEQKGTDFDVIENHFDELERELLDEYFKFVASKKDYTWIHWNMKDMIYGFAALEHRSKVLGGEPVHIEDSRKFDLHRALTNIYGYGYVKNPALINLMDLNEIPMDNLLKGEDEAQAFEDKDYVKLHQSSLRKVNVIVKILYKAADGTLKTRFSKYKAYRSTISGIAELVTEHRVFKLLGCVAIVASLIQVLVKIVGLFTVWGTE